MKRRLTAISLCVLLLLSASSCVSSHAGGGGGFDINRLLKNPLVMAAIVAIALWFAFRSSGSKHG